MMLTATTTRPYRFANRAHQQVLPAGTEVLVREATWTNDSRCIVVQLPNRRTVWSAILPKAGLVPA
jgi:hypothetical protein